MSLHTCLHNDEDTRNPDDEDIKADIEADIEADPAQGF